MTGEQLYSIWADEVEDQSVNVPLWVDLPFEQQEAWRKLALLFNESA